MFYETNLPSFELAASEMYILLIYTTEIISFIYTRFIILFLCQCTMKLAGAWSLFRSRDISVSVLGLGLEGLVHIPDTFI